jgi:hypothetical protein
MPGFLARCAEDNASVQRVRLRFPDRSGLASTVVDIISRQILRLKKSKFLFAQQFSLSIDMKPCYLGLANFLGGNIRAIRKRSVKSRQRLL